MNKVYIILAILLLASAVGTWMVWKSPYAHDVQSEVEYYYARIFLFALIALISGTLLVFRLLKK